MIYSHVAHCDLSTWKDPGTIDLEKSISKQCLEHTELSKQFDTFTLVRKVLFVWLSDFRSKVQGQGHPMTLTFYENGQTLWARGKVQSVS